MQSKNVSKYWGKPSDQPRHPYVEFENTPLWRAVKKALRDMEENQDLALNEWHQYVVGYVCKQLAVRGCRHATGSPEDVAAENVA
jgi:hypothetical protein